VSVWELLRNRSMLVELVKLIQQAVKGATTLAEAREKLAMRLAIGARAGDLDNAIKALGDSDALVEDFIKNG